MPITAIRFGAPWDNVPARDVHLLRGQRTGALRSRLWVEDADDSRWRSLADYEALHDDLKVSFDPVFRRDDEDAAGKRWKGFEIYVDKQSGDVEAKIDPPDPSPSSFMLEAVVDDNGTGSPLVPSTALRVQVHGSVTDLWLAPDKLTIRRLKVAGQQENTQCRFTVRAQFDDGTVGDVTDSGELTFTPTDWFAGGVIMIPASAGDSMSDKQVEVKTSTKLGGLTAKGTLDILPSWPREPDPPLAELVDGAPGTWDGTLKPEHVPNVLFISCGFTSSDADREAFAAITNKIVHEMKREQLLQPFGYLATSINYWRLFVPSRERGISLRSEVQPVSRQGLLFASVIASPLPPPPQAREWQTEHVLYMAGLPLAADLALVKDISDPANPKPIPNVDALRKLHSDFIDLTGLRQKWIKTMRLDFPDAMVNGILHDWLQEWLTLSERTFVDDVDNFPAMSIGEPPLASLRFPNMLQPHDLRPSFDRDGDAWKALFKRVKAAPQNGVTVTLDDTGSQAPELGNLWIEVRPGFAFDNRVHVAIVCNAPYGRANASIYMRLYVYAAPQPGQKVPMFELPVVRDPTRNSLKVQIPPFSIDLLRAETWRTFAHELGHTFGLGDEYAEGSDTYAGTEADLVNDANLTAFDTVVDPNDPDKHKVRYDQIKWNWHRIRNAAVLARPLGLRPGGLYLAFVRKRSVHPFVKGDPVRLRQRDTRKVLGKDPVVSNVEFVVDSVSPDDLDPPHDPALMTIVLKNDSIGINVEAFGAGSVVYVPIPAAEPRDPVLHPYLTLVGPGGERLMDKAGGTMQGTVCDVTSVLSPNTGSGTQVPAEEDPLGRIASPDRPSVVGVYYGGSLFACGILHPTGQCMMRNSGDDGTAFCPVCQYALVDRIDPDQHAWIDSDYEKKYPY